MFYCDSCGKKKGWPTDAFVQSRGPCEICKVRSVCNDISSKDLKKFEKPEPFNDSGLFITPDGTYARLDQTRVPSVSAAAPG